MFSYKRAEYKSLCLGGESLEINLSPSGFGWNKMSELIRQGLGCVARRLLATLEDQSSIPGAGNNNVLVTKSDWPTLVSSVC